MGVSAARRAHSDKAELIEMNGSFGERERAGTSFIAEWNLPSFLCLAAAKTVAPHFFLYAVCLQ